MRHSRISIYIYAYIRMYTYVSPPLAADYDILCQVSGLCAWYGPKAKFRV